MGLRQEACLMQGEVSMGSSTARQSLALVDTLTNLAQVGDLQSVTQVLLGARNSLRTQMVHPGFR